MSQPRILNTCLIPLLLAMPLSAATLVVRTGATEVTRGLASGTGGTKPVEGKITAGRVTFDPLADGDSLLIDLTLGDGRLVRLVDTSWPEPANDADVPEMTDADKVAVADLIAEAKTQARQFRIVSFTGNAKHAVAVIERIGDKTADTAPGQITWRVEVWTFEKKPAWQRREDQTRVIESKQFESADALKKQRGETFIVGVSAGLRVERGMNTQLTLPPIPKR